LLNLKFYIFCIFFDVRENSYSIHIQLSVSIKKFVRTDRVNRVAVPLYFRFFTLFWCVDFVPQLSISLGSNRGDSSYSFQLFFPLENSFSITKCPDKISSQSRWQFGHFPYLKFSSSLFNVLKNQCSCPVYYLLIRMTWNEKYWLNSRPLNRSKINI
jgi:hypothetical protein